MKVRVRQTINAVSESEVALPAYGVSDVGGENDFSKIHYMVDVDLRMYSVMIGSTFWPEEEESIELVIREKVDPDDEVNTECYFGLGSHASSREQFQAALAEARALLARFPDPVEGEPEAEKSGKGEAA